MENVTVRAVWRDGMSRVRRAPLILLGLWIITTLAALPLNLLVGHAIHTVLGSSLEADSAASGVNYDWMQEFAGRASGVAATFTPAVIGFAAVVDNLSALMDNKPRPELIALAALYVMLLTFLSGGIIDRYARDRPTHAHGFFTVSGVFFFRFLRLLLLAAVVYGLLFGMVHPWLFQGVYSRLTNDVTVERTAFLIRVALYLVFAVPLTVANLLFDYAKVRAVVEDRHSMIGAFGAAVGFVRRNRGGVLALYFLNVLLFGLVLAAYALLAPAAGSDGWAMWLAFVIGQLYVVARLWVKLLFWASETALFQSRLAHAGFVRRPPAAWPDSPAAEAIAR